MNDNDTEATEIAARWVARFGLGFHPDTRGADYHPPLTVDECRAYDSDMDRLFELGGDPYEYGLRAMRSAGLI